MCAVLVGVLARHVGHAQVLQVGGQAVPTLLLRSQLQRAVVGAGQFQAGGAPPGMGPYPRETVFLEHRASPDGKVMHFKVEADLQNHHHPSEKP